MYCLVVSMAMQFVIIHFSLETNSSILILLENLLCSRMNESSCKEIKMKGQITSTQNQSNYANICCTHTEKREHGRAI